MQRKLDPSRYVKYLGVEDGTIFSILLEERPKWLVLVMLLRKKIKMKLREAKELTGMRHEQLRRAIGYLSGVNIKAGEKILSTSTRARPLIFVEELSARIKILGLTKYGAEFAEKVHRMLIDMASKLGAVNVEKDLGISSVMLRSLVEEKLEELGIRDVDPDSVIIIDLDRFLSRMAMYDPYLYRVIEYTEILDAVPIEIPTPAKKHVLYMLIPSEGF